MLLTSPLQIAIISIESASRPYLPLTFDVSGAKLRADSYPLDFHLGGHCDMTKVDILQGTLDMLVLKTLSQDPMHGFAIALRIRQLTDEVIQIGEGSLYPALYRMELKGWIKAEWGVTENNRRAKYYKLTRTGRKQLEGEVASYGRLTYAIAKVLQAA